MTCLIERVGGYTRFMTDRRGCDHATHLEGVRPR